MNKNNFIDWNSSFSQLMLNPRTPQAFVAGLQLKNFPTLRACIWVASSGTQSSSGVISMSGPMLSFYGLEKRALLISAASVNAHLQANRSDTWLNVLPSFHVGGMGVYARAFLSESEVIDHSQEPWSIQNFHKWAYESKATLTSLVPTQLFDLVQEDVQSPESLRAVVVGGAKLDLQLYLKARALGYPILPSYGMTEVGSQIATARLETLKEDHNESMPPLAVLSHIELKNMDNDQLAVKSPSLFTAKCEWRAQNQNMQTLWRTGDWYVSQDRGKLKSELIHNKKSGHKYRRQFVEPLGRVSDQVKISGELVDLAELNSQFRSCAEALPGPAILFSADDNRRGYEVVLAVNISNYSRVGEIVEKFNMSVLPVSRIRAVYFVDELPTTSLQKVKLNDLKVMLGIA
jgi:o-succinylbenzoate---CoA ligase